MFKMSLREEWLTKAMDRIVEDVFQPNDLRFPPLKKISCGLCPGKAIGICVYPQQADDNCVHIFISPELGHDDVMTILGTIVHELTHCHVMGEGHECKHGFPFSKIIRTVGLEGPPKATFVAEGTELYATLSGIAAELGPYPHAPLRKKPVKTRKSEILTWISTTDEEFEVKCKFSTAYEKGTPRDFNGEPMKPKDPAKFDELEEDYGKDEEDSVEVVVEEAAE